MLPSGLESRGPCSFYQKNKNSEFVEQRRDSNIRYVSFDDSFHKFRRDVLPIGNGNKSIKNGQRCEPDFSGILPQ